MLSDDMLLFAIVIIGKGFEILPLYYLILRIWNSDIHHHVKQYKLAPLPTSPYNLAWQPNKKIKACNSIIPIYFMGIWIVYDHYLNSKSFHFFDYFSKDNKF